jgi:hypothetical protein
MNGGADVSMQDDQAAEFAALQAGAAGGGVAAVPGQGAAGPVAPDLATELTGFGLAIVAALSPAFPSLKDLYTDETTAAAGASIAAVCVKHGWLSGGLMGEYAEEITALMVCGPLAVATAQGVRSDIAALKARARPVQVSAPAPAPAAPAGDVVVLKREPD